MKIRMTTDHLRFRLDAHDVQLLLGGTAVIVATAALRATLEPGETLAMEAAEGTMKITIPMKELRSPDTENPFIYGATLSGTSVLVEQDLKP